MRSEEEVKQLYAEYLIRQGKAYAEKDKNADVLKGMSIAYGRTLGLTMRRIGIDLERFQVKAKEEFEKSVRTLLKSL